jgi:hypothetical protein
MAILALAVALDVSAARRLHAEATERNMTSEQLAAAIVKKIVEDDLFRAVLDD